MNINKTKKYFFLLLIGFFYQTAQAGFEPPVIIDPPNPQVGDMVRVGLFVEFYPPCLLLPQENSIGETHSLVFENNMITIDVLADTVILCNPIPFSPAPREYYDLGVLQEGEYTLQVNYISISGIPPELIPPFPLPDFFSTAAFGSTINFTVSGEPEIVNTLSWQSLFVLGALVLLSLTFIRKFKCQKYY